MHKLRFNIDSERFNRLFPFYLLIDADLKIVSWGKSMNKLYALQQGSIFSELFVIKNLRLPIKSFSDLDTISNQLCIIEAKNDRKVVLRGQFEYLDIEKCYLFVATPSIESINQVKDLNLSAKDFAPHDPVTDLLHILKTKETATEEIKQLLITLNQQKNELKQSEINYRSIVEMATDIIYKVNKEGYFTFVNDVAERITGYSKQELMRLNYLQLVRDDYKEKTANFYINQVENKIPTTYFEFPIATKNGKDMWIGQSVQYPQNEVETIELTALAIDISERKHAEQKLVLQEEKYRNIIANMNLGLLEVDTEDNIQYANQSFCDLSGFSQMDLIGKKAAQMFMSPKDLNILENKNEIRKEGVSDMYSVPVRNKKGEQRWWIISGAPRYNDDGKLLGSVGIHLDITEQKRLEGELQIAKEKAEESSKAKESFLATMSHEIRTPLNAIVGITELMKMDRKLRNKENLDILGFSAKNLLALISDILDLSKIDAGKIELSKNPVDIKRVLNEICQTFRPACLDKEVELLLNIDERMPGIVMGDELRLSQILNNLISNAVKFTPKGYVKITVKADSIDSNKMRLSFKVSDTGIGIRKSKIDTIFGAFEQADIKIVEQYGGTGLGLSITKKLIELQGGKITAESKLNKGSTFSFYMDCEISKAKKKQADGFSNAKRNLAPFEPMDKTILLVEDNIANQKVAISYLGHWGFKFEIANNGAEAIKMIKRTSYDLALIDLFMPVMDGFETIKRIRKADASKDLPIIALTASAESNLMDKALMLGANKCLTKPMNSQQLHDNIIDLLNFEKPEKKEIKKSSKAAKGKSGFRHINLKRIEEASLGSKKFMVEMLELLNSEIPGLINQASILLQKEAHPQFSKTIHKLKNNMLMLGMDALEDDIRLLEANSSGKTSPAKVKASFERLQSEWSNAIPELEVAQKQAI